MNATERTVWEHLEAVHAGDLQLAAFERWLFATPEAEAVLGPNVWLELLARDYRARHALHETRQQVERLYADLRPGALSRDRARRVARAFLAGERDLWSTCRVLAGLWAAGHDAWVPLTFVGLDSELDSIPAPQVRDRWDPVALQQVLARSAPWLAWAEAAAQAAARELLATLDTVEPAI